MKRQRARAPARRRGCILGDVTVAGPTVPVAGDWTIGQGKAATVHEPVFVLDSAGRIVAVFTTMTEADEAVRLHNSRGNR